MNLNVAPYYDDFDSSKNYHQVLSKPGVSVQARELTQIQSILKNQIGVFGQHVFKQGSIVIPGNSTYNLSTPFVKVYGIGSNIVNPGDYINNVVIGETSGVRAIVSLVTKAMGDNGYVFYLAYISGNASGETTFQLGEILQLEINSQRRVTVDTDPSGKGVGSLAFINKGVYFVNNTFVEVQRQSIVISPYNSTPTCRVALRIDESIVTSEQDPSLLDPAQGSNNYAAPGADRLKIELVLTTLDINSPDDDHYVEIMRFDNGVLLEHAQYPKYNELEKSLARRTFDESGDYVVGGFDLLVRENKREGINNGDSPNGDINKLTYQVAPGKAYLNGFEIESLAGGKLVVDKARTSAHVEQAATSFKTAYGKYILIADPAGSLDINSFEQVDFYNIGAASGGTKIGSAKTVAIDYFAGDGVNPIYKLYVNEIAMTSGSLEDIGSVRGSNFTAKVVAECSATINAGAFAVDEAVTFETTTRTGKVSLSAPETGKIYIYKDSSSKPAPKAGDLIIGSSSTQVVLQDKNMLHTDGSAGLLFELPSDIIKSIKDESNAYDIQYTVWKKLSLGNGASSVSIVTGEFLPIEVGTFSAFTSSGDDTESYSIDNTGKVLTRATANSTGAPITIYAQVMISGGQPRIKTVQTSSPITKTGATKITLNHADVFEIVSVVNSGVEIKNQFLLNNGATDFEYKVSTLELLPGFAVPVGDCTITYKFYNHTSGDFFCVDSYVGADIEDVPSYTSPSTGKQYQLRTCIDFRKTEGMSIDPVVSGVLVKTSIQRYLSRIDSICVDKNNRLSVVSGTPFNSTIKRPSIPGGVMELWQVFVPAYTFKNTDCQQKRVSVLRTTMEGVKKITDRVSRLEDYTTLSFSESELINTNIIDAATGLDKFKTGYIVENLQNPTVLGDVQKSYYRATFNNNFGIIPKLEETNLQVVADIIGGVVNTGGVLTLPYTEEVFAEVKVSSRVTNLNPFLIVSWVGEMILTPPSDNWTEVVELPDVVVEKEVVKEVINWIFLPPPPPPPVSTPVYSGVQGSGNQIFSVGPGGNSPSPSNNISLLSTNVDPRNGKVISSVSPFGINVVYEDGSIGPGLGLFDPANMRN